jgi:hypothetical protein
MFIKKNSGREARQANIKARMAHPSMNVDHQFKMMTDVLTDVKALGDRHIIFEVTE